MSLPSALIDLLAAIPAPAADHALGAALESLPPDETAPLVDLLLARATPTAFQALIERLHLLDDPTRQRIRAAGDGWRAVMPDVMRAGSSQARVNVLDLIAADGIENLSYLAVDALMDRAGSVRQAAAQLLKRLADDWYARVERTQALLHSHDADDAARLAALGALAASRAALVRTIAAAVERFSAHHHLEVLEAAMYFAEDLGPALFEPPAAMRGRYHHALLQVFTASSDPRLAAFAYAAIVYPDLRHGILSAIAARRDAAFFEAMIREHWRAREPAVRDALTSLHSLAWLHEGIAPLLALPEDLHAAGIDWLGRLGLPDDLLLDLLRGALDFECAAGLAQAAWVAAARHSPGSDTLLAHIAASPHPEAARVAQVELDRRRRLAAARSTGNQHESELQWGDFLRRHGMENSFESVWNAAERLIQSGTHSAGALLTVHLPEFGDGMRGKLYSSVTADRVRAHRLIAALHLETVFQTEIFSAADDPVATVRGMAVAAVARIGDATSRRILERCVNDPDTHVRASAVEALATLGGSRVSSLLAGRLTDDAPDVRSTTVRVLLRQRVPQAAECLISMLKDSRREHRLAALSLVAHMQLTAMLRRLMSMAELDPDVQVRQRAARILRTWRSEEPLAVSAKEAS